MPATVGSTRPGSSRIQVTGENSVCATGTQTRLHIMVPPHALNTHKTSKVPQAVYCADCTAPSWRGGSPLFMWAHTNSGPWGKCPLCPLNKVVLDWTPYKKKDSPILELISLLSELCWPICCQPQVVLIVSCCSFISAARGRFRVYYVSVHYGYVKRTSLVHKDMEF